MLAMNLTLQDFEKIQMDGTIKREGKSKLRMVGRLKKGVVVLTCEEYVDHIVIKTVTKGR
jgi:hypothetical protein